ncbi:MAG: class I SAM-dependent methyltransferase [Bacteroidales bacterium]|nr:class I SAM-dependent methyltransferase [Bacteroidales bacterium]
MQDLKYNQEYTSFSNNLQTIKVVDWIKNNSNVLEFGCHTGLLSRCLSEEKKAKVVGIDINKDALKIAKKYQIKTIEADLEDINSWSPQFENTSFDVITFLHILEHLKKPDYVLKNAIKLLNENGIVIIGLPNVSNAKDRFDMFFGKFEYSEIGIMDSTHIHMFNYFSALKLISDAGLEIIDYYSPWQVNPIKHFLDHLPVLHRLAKNISVRPSRVFKFSPNITDSVMLFKCKIK